jgi:hypothetical protein
LGSIHHIEQLADALCVSASVRDVVHPRLAEDVGNGRAGLSGRKVLEHHLHVAAQRPDARLAAWAMSCPWKMTEPAVGS